MGEPSPRGSPCLMPRTGSRRPAGSHRASDRPRMAGHCRRLSALRVKHRASILEQQQPPMRPRAFCTSSGSVLTAAQRGSGTFTAAIFLIGQQLAQGDTANDQSGFQPICPLSRVSTPPSGNSETKSQPIPESRPCQPEIPLATQGIKASYLPKVSEET